MLFAKRFECFRKGSCERKRVGVECSRFSLRYAPFIIILSSVGIEFGHISLRISLNLIDRVFQFVRIDVSENQGKEFVGVFHFVSLGDVNPDRLSPWISDTAAVLKFSVSKVEDTVICRSFGQAD